jgi:hypothetical protein
LSDRLPPSVPAQPASTITKTKLDAVSARERIAGISVGFIPHPFFTCGSFATKKLSQLTSFFLDLTVTRK